MTTITKVQLNTNLTPAGKNPRGMALLPTPMGAGTGTHARHKLPVTSYKHYYLSIVLNSSSQSLYKHTDCEVPVKYFKNLSTLHTSGRIHRIYRLTSLYFDRSIKVAGFRRRILPVTPF